MLCRTKNCKDNTVKYRSSQTQSSTEQMDTNTEQLNKIQYRTNYCKYNINTLKQSRDDCKYNQTQSKRIHRSTDYCSTEQILTEYIVARTTQIRIGHHITEQMIRQRQYRSSQNRADCSNSKEQIVKTTITVLKRLSQRQYTTTKITAIRIQKRPLRTQYNTMQIVTNTKQNRSKHNSVQKRLSRNMLYTARNSHHYTLQSPTQYRKEQINDKHNK